MCRKAKATSRNAPPCPPTLKPEDVTLENALALLSLPREVAKHPESGEPILAGIGRYGSYVQHKKTYANLAKDENVLEIGANRAIDLIMTKEARRRPLAATGGEIRAARRPSARAAPSRSRPGVSAPISPGARSTPPCPREPTCSGLTLEQAVDLVDARAAGAPSDGRLLGEHPDGGPIAARAGRFGPYVSWNKVFATLPKIDDAGDGVAGRGDQADRGQDRLRRHAGQKEGAGEKSAGQEGGAAKKPAAKAKAPAAKAKAPAAKAKPKIVESDEAPFEGGAPVKKPAAKKAAAKK